MEKKIPIDQLFYDRLSQGEEQLNLGAWANMERLLDGKNPYQDEEPKKKRRILPLLAYFVLLTGALTAGYLTITNHKSNKETNHKFVSNNKIENGAQQVAPSETINNSEDHLSENNQNSNTNQIANNENDVQINNATKDNRKAVSTINSKNNVVENEDKNLNINSKNNKSNISSNSENKNSLNENNNQPETKSDKVHINNVVKNIKSVNASNEFDKEITTRPKDVPRKIKTIIKDTVNLFEIQENISKSKNSGKKEFDTIGRYKKVIDKIVENTIDEVAVTPKVEVKNPRMVSLTSEQEINANKKIELNNQNESISTLKEVKTSSIVTTNTSNSKKSSSSQNSNSVFNKIKNASNKLAMKKIDLYPGMSVGINGALFNAQHNYGGFHFGLNNLIPISNYFSILSELKLFYKFNSGYTPQDIQTTYLAQSYSTDNVTLQNQNQTIHSYQIDSNTKKYNFKSFATLELPIMFQAHFGKFSPYLGANIAYLFKLNTSTINKQYIPTINDTLDNSVVFNAPANKSYQYVKEDFGSRFGFGYSIGVSYSFNPNLYLDLRMSNTLTDNSKTLSSKEISNGIFKIPFMQFSIGYRFKKFTPNN